MNLHDASRMEVWERGFHASSGNGDSGCKRHRHVSLALEGNHAGTLPQSATRAASRTKMAMNTMTFFRTIGFVEDPDRGTCGRSERSFAPLIPFGEMSSPKGLAINRPNKQWQERRDGRSYMQEEDTERRTAIVSFLEETQQDREGVNVHLRSGTRSTPGARRIRIQSSEFRGVARAASGRLRTRYLHPLPRGHGP